MNTLARFISSVAFVFLTASAAQALITEHGGPEEEFGGGGDKTPPTCLFNVPTTASEPFFIVWDCYDDVAPKEHIRSSIWIQRNGDTRPIKVADFLGSGSVFVDNVILQNGPEQDYEDGLPVVFWLEGTDKAGNTTISEHRTVVAGDTLFTSCSLSIDTAATESTGDSTGLPAMNVTASSITVSSTTLTNSSFSFSSPSSVSPSTCEIDSICENSNVISFQGTFVEPNSATLSVAPGISAVQLSGSKNSLSGSTIIDGASATVTLNCSSS